MDEGPSPALGLAHDCGSLDDGDADFPHAGSNRREAPVRSGGGEQEESDDDGDGDGVASLDVDVSGKNWEGPLQVESLPKEAPVEGLYVYNNAVCLMPSSFGRFDRLKKLKYFGNEINVLPPGAENLVELEQLQMRIVPMGFSSIPFQKLSSLRELELSIVPPRPSVFSTLTEITGLTRLTKLSICHLSIKYLPPEIGCLKKLEELDLSFNKLRSLPNDMSELSALKALRVSNNKLVGAPLFLSSLPRLENLDLSSNRLTSLAPLELSSMRRLQFLNLQHNMIDHDCRIPSWVCCIIEENENHMSKDECNSSFVRADTSDGSIHQMDTGRSCNDSQYCSSNSPSEAPFYGRCNSTKRMRKKWKRQNYFQQIARMERLNYSRKCRSQDHNESMTVKLAEHRKLYELHFIGKGGFEMYPCSSKVVRSPSPPKSRSIPYKLSVSEEELNGGSLDFVGHNDSLVFPACANDEKIVLHGNIEDDSSYITSDCAGLKGTSDCEAEVSSPSVTQVLKSKLPDEGSSSEDSKNPGNSKRHYDVDLDNPKRKCHRPFDGCSCLSCKYSTESFCGIDDLLPDGFYDAGRDRRCMPLCSYEQILHLDSREVILLDRETDEELNAIAVSAKKMLSKLKRSCDSGEKTACAIDDLHRASMLALFVSDFFGGSDRSYNVLRLRHAALGSYEQQPFVCTCFTGSNYNEKERPKQTYGMSGNINFADLCDKSLRLTKEARNSVIVPIGEVRFGVCRHRAVLMKYLCDRAEPPIPCELVRGYLDFRPHAWNAVLVKRGCSSMRMVVDACYPADIREETDPEYFCRYIPLSRIYLPLANASSFPSLSLFPADDSESAKSVKLCKFGSLTAAAKVRNLETCGLSKEDITIFEYTFLGEVRLLGALRKHKCIVEIYGHHLSSRWVTSVDGKKDQQILHSAIIMEYIRGGSLKNHLIKLSKRGEKHVPLNLALYIARDVACALVEVHSKHIIHRDIKSENILIDLERKENDGGPLVKLCDFNQAVPLHSFLHSCCIAHLGIHPPDVCVGTPRWMAPEVFLAMHERIMYGLEVDIWSYGCFLLELLTLQIPYEGLPASEIKERLERKQRPPLTPELEELSSLDKGATSSTLGLSYSDNEIEALKLLVDLFYRCTRANPAERPTAGQMYDRLCNARFWSKPDASDLVRSTSTN